MSTVLYTNHSGGAEGSDMAWELVGKEYGVKTIAYSFPGHRQFGAHPYIMTKDELYEGWRACVIASKTLKRRAYPMDQSNARQSYIANLICRNWFQVKHADAIYAIGTLKKDQDKLVDGGTGWAVQMAVDNKKPVYLFDQDRCEWLMYDYVLSKAFIIFSGYAPTLTRNFAGIGTRQINDAGIRAIQKVYEHTFVEAV